MLSMLTIMTYSESAEDVRITLARAFQELENHGLLGEFDCPLKELDWDGETLDAGLLLRWMG